MGVGELDHGGGLAGERDGRKQRGGGAEGAEGERGEGGG
jgi:hypothetical protein